MNNSKKYDWDAKDYSKNSQNQFQWAEELIPTGSKNVCQRLARV
jgi:hypothetical protein